MGTNPLSVYLIVRAKVSWGLLDFWVTESDSSLMLKMEQNSSTSILGFDMTLSLRYNKLEN